MYDGQKGGENRGGTWHKKQAFCAWNREKRRRLAGGGFTVYHDRRRYE